MPAVSTTTLELLKTMKNGVDVPLPVLADALRDEGRDELAEWVLHKTRLIDSYLNHIEYPIKGQDKKPMRYWFQVRSDNSGWLGGYCKRAHLKRPRAINAYAKFLWRFIVDGEELPKCYYS